MNGTGSRPAYASLNLKFLLGADPVFVGATMGAASGFPIRVGEASDCIPINADTGMRSSGSYRSGIQGGGSCGFLGMGGAVPARSGPRGSGRGY